MSYRSALETEVAKAAERLRRNVAERDRAVLIGLLLSVTPFPPSAFLGLLLSFLNLALILNGKLARREMPLVAVAILLALANLSVFVLLLGIFRSEIIGLWNGATRLVARLVAMLLHGNTLSLPNLDNSIKHV